MNRRVNNQLPNNLIQLQNCIKRDPIGYQQEFHQQYEHFKSLLEIFQFDPSSYNKEFIDLVMFLAHVCAVYPDELVAYPKELVRILKLFSTSLNPEVRLIMVRALILLRNKSLLAPNDLLALFFELLKCQDKKLRMFIRQHIITDIKNINSKQKNHKVNTVLQNFMFSMLKDSNVMAAKTSLHIMIELYHRNVWKNSKTVNVIATALFSKIPKIMIIALKFFLGKDETEQDGDGEDGDSDEDDDLDANLPSAQEIAQANRVNKKTRKRKRLLQRSKEVLKKHKKKSKPESFDFSAIHLLNDPQTLAENLFKTLETFSERFEFKLMLVNFISRLIGIHQLFLLNFYPYLQRYLHPRQQEVTKFLQYVAQASHELVPPDVIEPILKVIANNFVTERNSNEVMAVGINSIREICVRCPLAMDEDLLQDLVAYSSFKEKNVSMAAKSLIQLFRVVNPRMLKKKDRGRPTEASAEHKTYQYGELKAVDFISGTEILDENEPIEEQKPSNKAKDKHVESDSENSWIDVSDDDGDDQNITLEDSSEDEKQENPSSEDQIGLDPKEKAAQISVSRILNQEEFQKVKKEQLSKQLRAAMPKRFRNKTSKSSDGKEPNPLATLDAKEVVSLSSIERLYKKRRADKQSRLESIESGRKDRGKFGSRKAKLNEFAGKSKKEAKKGKTFMMIKHKLNKKRKKSFKEKQASLRNSLLKRCQ